MAETDVVHKSVFAEKQNIAGAVEK